LRRKRSKGLETLRIKPYNKKKKKLKSKYEMEPEGSGGMKKLRQGRG